MIGENIHITIEDIQKGQVKVSIDAPRDIMIVREEIIQQTTQANKAAIVQKNSLQALSALADQIKRKGTKTEQ